MGRGTEGDGTNFVKRGEWLNGGLEGEDNEQVSKLERTKSNMETKLPYSEACP